MKTLCQCGHALGQHHVREDGGRRVCDYAGHACQCRGYTLQHYPYPAADRYRLTRDGVEHLTAATEGECWNYLHNVTAASVEHALRHEGWKMEPVGGTS